MPTLMEKRILKALLWVWLYYEKNSTDDDDGVYLEHRNMSAGEEATRLLEEFGLAVDQGYGAILTPAGRALMHDETVVV